MMLKPRDVVLAPTTTYTHRLAYWLPMLHPSPDRLAITTIDQSGKVETAWYDVEEWQPTLPSCRRFQLRKMGTDAAEVAQVGAQNFCTCPAGSKGRRRECKHQDSLLALFYPKAKAIEPELYDEFSPAIGAGSEVGK